MVTGENVNIAIYFIEMAFMVLTNMVVFKIR